ncbi:MAG: hypothetical protein P8179_14345 [Candidatus Thiodiazotropha sp.]
MYQDTSQGNQEIVMDRLPDIEAGEALDFQRLNSNVWSPQVNDAWVQGGIDSRKKFYLGSPTTVNNLRTQSYPYHSDFPHTVTYRELKQLQNSGYTRVGNYLVPPN